MLPTKYSYYIHIENQAELTPSQTLIHAATVPITHRSILETASALGDLVTKVSLTLAKSSFSIGQFEEMLRNCPFCKKLDLSYCPLNDSDLKKIAAACQKFASEHLHTIYLHSIRQITITGVNYFESCPQIKKISLQHNVNITTIPHSRPFHNKIKLQDWTGYS